MGKQPKPFELFLKPDTCKKSSFTSILNFCKMSKRNMRGDESGSKIFLL
jgi:hypothetical protein